MTEKHTGETQRDEHAVIGGIAGKKVFVIDNAGNQITQFSSPTVVMLPYSVYQQLSLVSGYNYYGFAVPGSNPTTSVFKIMRETINTGEVLFGNGSATFVHRWSAASLASLSYS